jgi:ATP-dependent DNA helicase RecG
MRAGKRHAPFDRRRLMEQALVVMRQSVGERRSDGRASPKVGAVLWMPDGTTRTACRGELRDGDHAEYTLLERKSRDAKLDDAVLFATLEPCAPGSRRHPKLGCAERIVAARIKQVWVGVEDPDPTVDRKGIKYLQDSGVVVHMFDRDLQEEIQAENRDFCAQAIERAAEARAAAKKTNAIILSPLEGVLANVVTTDLSNEALRQYRGVARIGDEVGSQGFHRRLLLQGLLKDEGGRIGPTGFGLLLFGKEPRTVLPQAGLLGTIHYADGTEEPRDFDGPQVLVPERALQWLRDKIPDPIDRTAGRTRRRNDVLFELVREGMVNALVHRDYSIAGAKNQLVVTPHTVAVKSPGKPVEPITLEQMQSFDAPMLSRNPVLHYVFARMELAEERGLGLKSMRSRAEAAGLPLPRYAWEAPYLVLTMFRTAESAAPALPDAVLAELTAEQREGWTFLARRTVATQREYAEHLEVTARTAQRHLSHFVELGLLQRSGRGPATRYEVKWA